MKSHSLLNSRMARAALCLITMGAGLFVFRAQADQWDKKTILTVDQPVQVKERLLPPGTYVFKLLNSNSDRHIVQIFNGDQSQIIDTVLAVPNYRLQPTGKSQFSFWETPPGTVKALHAWFYPGDNFGQEFPYPQHLAMLEANAGPAPAPPVAVAPEPTPTEAETPAPQPEPQPVTQEQQPEETQPPLIAENTPPPTPAPAPEAEPAPQQPASLPKTSSSYPLIGLAGLLSFGLYGLLRLARSS
jgi:outer membrane biosynthesis protein TonB